MTVQTLIQETPRIDGEIALSQIRTGDIIFCAGPGPLQDLANRAGEPWRHVGIAVSSDEGISIVEVAGPKFRLRSLAHGLGNVTEAAVGRVATADQRHADAAATWCKGHVDRKQIYAWDDVILTGFIAATRRFSLAEDEERLTRMVTAAVSDLASRQSLRAEQNVDSQRSYSCSAFVVAAFLMVGYPLELDLGLPRSGHQRPSLWELVRAERRPLRSACGCRISAEQTLDTVRALVKGMLAAPENGFVTRTALEKEEWYRWASPGDIWRSPTLSKRLALEL